MIMEDHIGLPLLAGKHPLVGPNDADGFERFPAMSDAYDSLLGDVFEDATKELGLGGILRRGTYCFVSGPSYETTAEARMLRGFGADVVGMSTVPEVVVARRLKLRVLGVSLVTNALDIDGGGPDVVATHEEVLAATADATKNVLAIFDRVLRSLGDDAYLESLKARGASKTKRAGNKKIEQDDSSVIRRLRTLDLSKFTPLEALEELHALVAAVRDPR